MGILGWGWWVTWVAVTGGGTGAGFDVVPVAEGVVALVRARAPGFVLDSNVTFIIGPDEVIAVDANLTPTSAEASIAALAALTRSPVTLLVNTHRHADHTGGNGAYVDAFPGLEIIAHDSARADLEAYGQETLDGWVGWATTLTRDLPELLRQDERSAEVALTGGERRSAEADLEAARTLVADASRLRLVLPTRTVSERLTLARAGRTVELLHLGKGHTRGDLVVWLPEERVVVTGDLVVAPVPLVGADQSYVDEWVSTLDRLLDLGAEVVVPGHGPVLRGAEQILLYRDFLAAVAEQASRALAEGKTLDEAVRGMDMAGFRARMTGGDPVLERLFDAWGPRPAVGAVFRTHGR